MADDFKGQQILSPVDLQAIPLLNTVNVVKGSTATLLTRPAGKKMIYIHVKGGDWNLRVGDLVSAGMPAAYLDAATVTDGTAGLGLKANERLLFQAPDLITVKGYNAGDLLTYVWL